MLTAFSLDPSMIATVDDAFYPIVLSKVMLRDRDAVVPVGTPRGTCLDDSEILRLTPAAILPQTAPKAPGADGLLPSAGTEVATARANTKLAKEGDCALLVKTPYEERPRE